MKQKRSMGHLAAVLVLAFAAVLSCGMRMNAQAAKAEAAAASGRLKGPCDVYAAAKAPCVAAHSTTRALYASYDGPLYQVLRQSDGKTLDIGVVQPAPAPAREVGGYANAAAQDRFCAGTYCWITTVYDQSPKHNDLTQAPRGGFAGPAMGGLNNLPLADMAPVSIMGHKVYGVFIQPGTGLRIDDAKGTAVDDQAEGQYWVINGRHFNSGCCFDYGNAEIDSRDDDNGTMETTYFGDATPWFHGTGVGPWIMTDQENNLVGCVNADGSKLCPTLPKITWRFATAMAKGEPHHWTSLGGDAQKGNLAVMFDGPRIDATYDPMRKQGAILLGNGGDNSNSSQGTFYEGAMTAANTFPSDATDQLVQQNVVAAAYDVAALSVSPALAEDTPPGSQTFAPGSSQDVAVTFINTTGAPATNVRLSLSLPARQWSAVVQGTGELAKTFTEAVAPGAKVTTKFKVTSGPAAFNGDLVANAAWTDATSGQKRTETALEKVRNVSAVRINEFRVSSAARGNATDSFIELHNAGSRSVDLGSWTLTTRASQQTTFSAVTFPAGTKLAAGGFYLLGLSNSGLAAPARTGDTTLYVRSTTGISAGDTVTIGDGAGAETRKVVSVGTAAGDITTLWLPLPDGPIHLSAGATNVPVASAAHFVAGEKIAMGYGATFPAVARTMERYEIASVTSVGKPGTQAYLVADAAAGATNLKVTSVENISTGDKIRLDIDSPGHGIETVTVKVVGTQANRTNLAANASAGATNVKVRRAQGFDPGDKLIIGTPATRTVVTITAVGTPGPNGTGIDFTPSLAKAHVNTEEAVVVGTGLDLAEPLRFPHAANLPFSNRGTGISFAPATAFAHLSDEPVQALGTGIVLDRPLAGDHGIDAVVRDTVVKNAGYQGMPVPNQWFGGPTLSTNVPFFDRIVTIHAGSMALRDAAGVVVDSLSYGGMTDPWTAQGYQGTSGPAAHGCFVEVPATRGNPRRQAPSPVLNVSAGRIHDGLDTGSSCNDFVSAPATILTAAAAAGATSVNVEGTTGIKAGAAIRIGTEADEESVVVAAVGPEGERGAGTPITLTRALTRAHGRDTLVTGKRATPGAPN